MCMAVTKEVGRPGEQFAQCVFLKHLRVVVQIMGRYFISLVGKPRSFLCLGAEAEGYSRLLISTRRFVRAIYRR